MTGLGDFSPGLVSTNESYLLDNETYQRLSNESYQRRVKHKLAPTSSSRRKDRLKVELSEEDDDIGISQTIEEESSTKATDMMMNGISILRRQSSSSSLSTESNASSSGVSSSGVGVSKVGRHLLANKLRQNWLQKATEGKEILDDSLTNLNWLHNLNSTPLESAQIQPISADNSPMRPLGQQHQLVKSEETGEEDDGYSGELIVEAGSGLTPTGRPDYRNGPAIKPPYSYASLICMAMRELGKPKITLSDIYGWITDNFVYYRLADTSWQNSVRHNLSLNKCFEKVPRRKDEPGKGGFWRINAKYAGLLENGLTRRRAHQQRHHFVCPPLTSSKSSASTSHHPYSRHGMALSGSANHHYASSYSSNLVRSQPTSSSSHRPNGCGGGGRLFPACSGANSLQLIPSPPPKRSLNILHHNYHLYPHTKSDNLHSESSSTNVDINSMESSRPNDPLLSTASSLHVLPAASGGPSSSSYYYYPRRSLHPPHQRWPNAVPQYRTAESNDRVETQMRDLSSLDSSPCLSSTSNASPPHSASSYSSHLSTSSICSPPTSGESCSTNSSLEFAVAPGSPHSHQQAGDIDPLAQMFFLVDEGEESHQPDPLGQRLEDVLHLDDTAGALGVGVEEEESMCTADDGPPAGGFGSLVSPGPSSTSAGEELANWSPNASASISDKEG